MENGKWKRKGDLKRFIYIYLDGKQRRGEFKDQSNLIHIKLFLRFSTLIFRNSAKI